MSQYLNIVKLCVGVESVQDLIDWRAANPTQAANNERRHVTRMWPKRETELLAGGSLYWVIKGVIRCRQRILRLDEVIGQDGIRRCGIVMDGEIIRTQSAARRPFQGWRYLEPADAPPDLPNVRAGDDALPDQLAAELAAIGVI